MQEQVPVTNAASLTFALSVLAEHTRADAFTPITVQVTDFDGVVTYPGEALHYSVESLTYDAVRNEYVLKIDQSRQAPGECQFTQSHTRAFCGNPRCRER